MAAAGRKEEEEEEGAGKVGRVSLNNVHTHSNFLVCVLVLTEFITLPLLLL